MTARCHHCGGTLYRERIVLSRDIETRCLQCGREQGVPSRQ